MGAAVGGIRERLASAAGGLAGELKRWLRAGWEIWVGQKGHRDFRGEGATGEGESPARETWLRSSAPLPVQEDVQPPASFVHGLQAGKRCCRRLWASGSRDLRGWSCRTATSQSQPVPHCSRARGIGALPSENKKTQ